jgi:hypothetical protein
VTDFCAVNSIRNIPGENMQKLFVAAIAFTLTATAASAQTAPADPYANPIEQCIRDNAAKVEPVIADLNQAADFLVGKLCAVQIADQTTQRLKQIQQNNAERIRSLCDQQTAAKDDRKSDDSASPVDYCAIIKNASAHPSLAQAPQYDPWVAGGVNTNALPPAAVALAAQLLLDLRASHKHR